MGEPRTLAEKIRYLVGRLDAADIPYLIGGALALAYHVAEPRATQDIDIQVYPPADLDHLLAALPDDVAVSETDRRGLERDLQIRLWWDRTPLDLFLPADPFHEVMRQRADRVPFPGLTNPLSIVSATDLTVLKALFDRPKDWVDIADMVAFGSVDVADAARWLREFGQDDRARRLLALP